MYSRSFFDLDGHGWQVMWMDPAAAEQGPEAFAASAGRRRRGVTHHCVTTPYTTEKGQAVGKLLWHTMMTLDGFTAGPNDDMSWMSGLDAGSRETVDEVLASTGALLVGRRTQDVEDRNQPGFYGGAFSGPFFVLRHDPPPEPPVVKGVAGRFLDVDIAQAVAIAKNAAGDGDVVVLGSNIARQCLEARAP